MPGDTNGLIVPWERLFNMSKEDVVRYYPHALAMGMEMLASRVAEYSNAEAQEEIQEYSRMCVRHVLQNHRKPEEAVLMGMGVMRRLVCDGQLIFQPNSKVPNTLRISYSGDMGTLIGAFVVALASYFEGGQVHPETWSVFARNGQQAQATEESARLAATFAVATEPMHWVQ